MKYITFVTHGYDFDLGCSFAEERLTNKEFMSNNLFVNKNTSGISAIMSCEGKIILLSSVVFCVVRTVCKFGFGLAVNCTQNK